ncbi:hypothetical protein BD408DRAFT_425504 [Parasitella parasitica]|nr:hypothetical protein BD408DRAFT_425504 [Parasitella parasitica]
MENSKGKREISKLLERVLNQDASKEINCMVKYKERSRYVFHTRMKTLRDSFKINYTFPGENSSPSTPNCTFEVFKLFDNRSILGQCQLNLTSYRLGKLREKEEQVLPITTVRNNYEKYHSSLRESLDNPTLSYREYARYCKILVKVVERLGAYPLFFPEILPPSTFKKVAQDDFSKIQDYFDELFSEFRDIARFDDNDDLILTESAGSSNYSDEKDAYHSRFLKNE